MKKILITLVAIPLYLFSAGAPKASLVNVLPIKEDVVNELQMFVGTTKFNKSSKVASQNSGVVKDILFDEGNVVKKNQILVKLDSDILNANIASLKASINSAKLQLEQYEKDLARYETLLKSGSIVQKTVDDQRYNTLTQKQKLIALQADLRAKEIEREKKLIRAPFSGTIVSKSIEVGEWANSGTVVATIVDTKDVDLEYSVPASFLSNIKVGQELKVNISDKVANAKIYAIIPKGDVATRTFPLKLKLTTPMSIYEGMKTSVNLPSKKERKSLVVHRDAVIKKFGQDVVFVDMDSKAMMVPVKVVGFKGNQTAIESPKLKSGAMVVVKGNERIFPNTPIKAIPLNK
jgi:RND family efflux transporter MFP subunit